MTDIHDIKPILYIPADWGWWVWALIALVLLAAGLVWWRWRRRHPVQPAVTVEPLSPHDEAYVKLDALAQGEGIAGKLYYFRLSAILRHYMERRFGLPAAEMTLEELLPELACLPLGADLVQPLKSFCRAAELIKFADAPVDSASMARDLAFVRTFVQRTTPPEADEKESAREASDAPPLAIAGEGMDVETAKPRFRDRAS
jgi:Domain of unknown function (DUF4381)